MHVSQPTTAGVAVVVRQLVADQVARGWHVDVACPPDGDLPGWVREAGARHLPWPASRSPGPSVPRELRALSRLVAASDPHLVHLHSAKAGLVGRLLLRGRRPTVFQPHGWSFLAVSGPVRVASTAWERAGARWASSLAVVSAGERSIGESAGVRGRWTHTPNGLPLAAHPARTPASRAAARRAADVEDEPVVVCVGRLCRQKGQDVLLDVWPSVRAAVPGARLRLVGDGPDRPVLEQRARRLPAGEVTLVGAVHDVVREYALADLVVAPSRWEAGLPLTAREAMAAGTPVVVTALPGCAEDLPPGSRVTVPVDDRPALVRALVARLTDDELSRTEGESGRRWAEQRFDDAKTTSTVAELYRSLLCRPRRGAE
jgi:glycosyltransferase involved in cell wall biosynthesis